MIQAQDLAEAVAHWLRFEDLCCRKVLFTERHMSHAIGQFLLSNYGTITPEVSHPVESRLKIDFGVTDDQGVLTDVVETKLVNETNRNFPKEICHDLSRLELASSVVPNCWLLVAGLGSAIMKHVVREEGAGVTSPLQDILSPHRQQGNDTTTVDIFNSTAPLRDHWQNWYLKQKLPGVHELTTQLTGRWVFDFAIDEDIWMCFVWRVRHTEPRVEFNW